MKLGNVWYHVKTCKSWKLAKIEERIQWGLHKPALLLKAIDNFSEEAVYKV